jgi:hypothetical protein
MDLQIGPKQRKKRRAGAETPEILAHRMALYLRAIGIEPVAPAGANQRETQAAYDQQWAALPLYWRSRAKRLARTQVMATGLAHSLATAPFATAVKPPERNAAPEVEAISIVCPHCRMRGGFPKRAWFSRQLSEEALLRALEIPKNFTGLHIYECPHMSGLLAPRPSPGRKRQTVERSGKKKITIAPLVCCGGLIDKPQTDPLLRVAYFV